MRLETVEEKEILVAGGGESYNSTVDQEDMAFVLHILSSNLYANPIDSLVREYTTNGWDAQKDRGVDKPMIVSIQTDSQGTYWSIRDFGTGLSPELVRDVYSKFGKSTKKQTDDYHGCWGLGKYSGLSYTDTIHITTWVGGTKYLYLMYRAEVGIKIDKLFEQESDEETGTEIRVYLKNYQDKQRFILACKSQLAYFENVYFNGEINNNYKIHQGKYYRCCTLYPLDVMHLTLGEVVYPIPFTQLGININSAPIGIKFEIGELSVTPNRETIQVKAGTAELIKARMVLAADEIISKFNEQTSDTEDLAYYFQNKNSDAYVDLSGKRIALNQLRQVGSKDYNKVTYKPYKDLARANVQMHSLLFSYVIGNSCFSFHRKPSINTQSMRGLMVTHYDKKATPHHTARVISIQDDYKGVFFVDESLWNISAVTLRYIFETHGCKEIVQVKQVHSLSNYISYLRLTGVKKQNWRKYIKDYREFATKLLGGIEIHEAAKIKPTDEWLQLDRARRSKNFDYHQIRKAEGKILMYKGRVAERHNGTELCVYEKEEVKIKNLLDNKQLVVYAPLSEKRDLAKLAHFTLKKMKFLATAEPNLKYMEQIPNYISYKKLMEGKNKIIGRAATAWIIKEFIENNKYVFSHPDFVAKLNKSFAEKIQYLRKYCEKNMLCVPTNSYASPKKFAEELVELVTKTRWFDYAALDVLREVEEKSPYISFIQHLKGYRECTIYHDSEFRVKPSSNFMQDTELSFAAEYIRYRKGFRLNPEFYGKQFIDKLAAAEPSSIVKKLLEKEAEVEIINTELMQEAGFIFVDDTESSILEENITDGNQEL